VLQNSVLISEFISRLSGKVKERGEGYVWGMGGSKTKNVREKTKNKRRKGKNKRQKTKGIGWQITGKIFVPRNEEERMAPGPTPNGSVPFGDGKETYSIRVSKKTNGRWGKDECWENGAVLAEGRQAEG
jgi:hypothetical protein